MRKKGNEVFIGSLLLAVLIIIGGILFNTSLGDFSGKIMTVVSTNFGWLYVLSVFGFILFLFFIACSKWGNIKLGKDTDKP